MRFINVGGLVANEYHVDIQILFNISEITGLQSYERWRICGFCLHGHGDTEDEGRQKNERDC